MTYTNEDLERMKRYFGLDRPGIKRIYITKEQWKPPLKRPIEWYLDYDYLDRSYRNLNEVPKEIRKCKNVEVINLSNNNIKEITYINFLENLEGLWISRNKLTKVDGLNNLPNLKTLDLSENEITDIYKLVYVPSLKKIDLDYNKLRVLDFRVLSLLPNLEELSLNDNEIKEFCNYKSLEKIKNLKFLEIVHNHDLFSHPNYKKTVASLRKKGVVVIDGIFSR